MPTVVKMSLYVLIPTLTVFKIMFDAMERPRSG